MRNKKNCPLFTVHRLPFYILLATCYLLLATFFSACGRRGDPVAITPYKEVPVVKDLKTSIKNGDTYLTWGMPEAEHFPVKALKGFVIFRAEVPKGTAFEDCECPFSSIDFIAPDSKKTFEYLDKTAIKGNTYLYKLVVMDKNNRMGKDSSVVLVQGVKLETKEVIIPPKAPAGLVAVYTQKNVVLAWDEVRIGEIKFYKIYRSEGKDFVAIGTSATTAFTDKDIEVSKKYYYRVTAVSVVEGPPSKEILVVTEIH